MPDPWQLDHSFPEQCREITQSMTRRIRELRFNLTAYDAAFVALAEQLAADEPRSEVVLATLDRRLAATPLSAVQLVAPED